jgi:hypothetical protein
MADIEPIPEGFLAKLLQEFGFQWTHLVVISGVVFSSFGLQKYLDPGIWILGTIMSFGIVYLFRNYVSANFLRTSITAVLAVAAVMLTAYVFLYLTHQEVGPFLESRTKFGTMYVAVAIGIPLGVMILSYKSQDDFLRTPLPPALSIAARNLAQMDFVHESVNYVISFLTAPDNADVIMRFEVTMDVINRTKRDADYEDYFDPAGRNMRFLSATVGNSTIDAKDRGRDTKRGLLIKHRAQPGKFRIVVVGESTFYTRDNELVGVYYPSNSLSIRINNPPTSLHVQIESLLSKKVEPQVLASGDILFQCSEGVLPFQGARIFWERK